MIFLAMILLGCLLGFAGAGGAGLTITLLSVGFGVPIHTALGVALAAMSFTMLSGAVSHFREGDVLLRLGLTTGGAGMLGAFAGARISDALPGDILSKMTAALMLASSVLLYFILFRKDMLDSFVAKHASKAEGASFYAHALTIGVVTGFFERSLRYRCDSFYPDKPDAVFWCIALSCHRYNDAGYFADFCFRRFRIFSQWSH